MGFTVGGLVAVVVAIGVVLGSKLEADVDVVNGSTSKELGSV